MATTNNIEMTFQFKEKGTGEILAALKDVSSVVEKMSENLGFSNTVIRSLSGSVNKLKTESENAGKAVGKIPAEAQKAKDPFSHWRDSLKEMHKGFTNLAFPLLGLQTTINLVSQAFSGLSQAISATVGQAVKLETTMAKIQNITGGGTNAQKLSAEVIALSNAYGRSAQDIAQQVRETIALGLAESADEAMTVVSNALAASIGTFSDLGTSISGAGSLMQAFGLSVEETTSIIAKMETSAMMGKATIDQLAQTTGQFSTIAAMAGVTLDETLAAMGTLTKIDNASEAATNLSNLMQKMITPTEEVQGAFEKLGYSSIQTEMRTKGLAKVIQELRAYELQYLGDGKLFIDMQAKRAWAQLTTQRGMEDYTNGLRDMGTAEAQLQEKINRAMATSEERMARLKTAVENSLLKVGVLLAEKVLPALLTAAEGIGKVFNLLAAIIEVIDWQEIAAGIGLVTAAFVAFKFQAVVGLVAALPALVAQFAALAATLLPIVLTATALVATFVAAYVATRTLMENLDALADIITGGLVMALASVAKAVMMPFRLVLSALALVSDKAKNLMDSIDKKLMSIEDMGSEGLNRGLQNFKVPDFSADINAVKDAMNGLNVSFNKTTASAKKTKNEVKELFTVPLPTESWTKANDTIEKLRLKIEDLKLSNSGLPDGIRAYKQAVIDAERDIEAFRKTDATAEQVAQYKTLSEQEQAIRFAALKKQSQKDMTFILQSEQERTSTELEEKFTALEQQRDFGLVTAQQVAQARDKLSQEWMQKEIDRIEKVEEARKKAVTTLNGNGGLTEFERMQNEERGEDARPVKARTGVIGSTTTTEEKPQISVAQGAAEGLSAAKSGVSGVVSFVASKFGVIGQIISAVIDLLVTPETTRQFVDNFFGKGVWQFVDGILNNVATMLIPGIIEHIPEAVTASIQFLIQGIPDFVKALINGIISGMKKAIASAKILWQNLWASIFGGKKKSLPGGGETVLGGAGAGAGGQGAGGSEEFAIREYRATAEGASADMAEQQKETSEDYVGNLITWMQDKFTQFFGWLKDGWTAAWKEISDLFLLEDVFAIISASFDDLTSKISIGWAVVKDFFNLSDIFAVLDASWQDFYGKVSTGWEAIRQMFDLGDVFAVVRASWNDIKVKLEGGLRYIKSLFNFDGAFESPRALWDNLQQKLVNGIAYLKSIFKFDGVFSAVESAWDGLKNKLNTSISALKSMFKFDGVFSAVEAAWDGLKLKLENAFSALKAMFKFDNVFSAVESGFESVKTRITNGWIAVKNILKIDNIFESISNAWANLYNNIVRNWNYIKSLLPIGDIFATISYAWDKFTSKVNTVWTNLKSTFEIGDIFSTISYSWDTFTSKVNTVWTNLKAKFDIGDIFAVIRSGFDTLTVKIATVWDGIKAKFNIGDIFSSALAGFNAFTAKLGAFSFDLGSKLKLNIDYKGKGTVENFLGIDFPWANFASGGRVFGSASGGDSERNDTVPALLSPGEFVVPRSVMQKDGVPALMNALMAGNSLPGYANGGVIRAAWGLKRIAAAVVTGGASEAARAVGLPAPDEYAKIRATFNSLNSVLGGLDIAAFAKDPSGYIGNVVRSKIGQLADIKKLYGFSEGGIVPGPAAGDVVPALLSGGEMVLNRNQQRQVQASAGNVTLNFNVAAGAVFDRPAVERAMPLIIDAIRRASTNGQPVLNTRGVRA